MIKVAKLVLIPVLTLFLFYKLYYSYHLNKLIAEFSVSGETQSGYWLAFAILFMFFNWGLESWKWRFLISKFEPVSLKTSIKAVLSGVTLSVITPNQIGDFAGRVIHLEFMDKIRGSLVTVIGHSAQVIITLFFGLFALGFFSDRAGQSLLWMIPALLLMLGLILLYVRMYAIYHHYTETKFLRKYHQYWQVFGHFKPLELAKVLGWSFLRYVVFMSQYYFLLRFFGVDIGWMPALACIVATFCVQSVVPSFILLEIGLRGASALFFFSMFTDNHLAILLSAYSLWMVNMLIPAILGLYFILRVRA